jgi:cytochrome c biogenesis protein CcmG, thiol:disulfide interchange protein DsbE
MSGVAEKLKKTGLVLLCALVLCGCHSKPATSSAPPGANPNSGSVGGGEENKQVGWTLSSTQHIRLADYRQKVVVLDFYATWCEPCRDSVPHLVELQQRYAADGLQVIGLNVGGESDHDQVPAFAREFHIQYQLGIPDPELEALYLGGDDGIPQTFVLDRQGKLVHHIVGYSPSVAGELDQAIRTALASN